MSEKDHTDILTAFEGEMVLDPMRTTSIHDPKWAHPELRDYWVPGLELGAFTTLYDPKATIDEKLSVLDSVDFSIYYPPIDQTLVDMQEYDVPGCPEEPDAPMAKVYVYRPAKLKGKTGQRVIFQIAGGGMLFCEPKVSGLDQLSLDRKCVVVGVKYRISMEEPYPAAINDLHAGYAWMIEHADELGIDLDSIIISGASSGGHLALSLPFRLKRYDWCGGPMPRGIVAINPITDDREVYPCSEYLLGFTDGIDEAKSFDSVNYHTAYRAWLGYNYGSYRVGPEALANHATVEDCIGYPPSYIETTEFDPDRDYNREFVGKLYAAHTYCDYHCLGGANHHAYSENPDLYEFEKQLEDRAYESFWEHDFRRPWVVDDYKARFKKRFGME
jgi:acetyl esterase/lipase